MSQKHSHYHKDVSHLKSIDIYRLLELFDVTDQAIGHAVKKLMCAGKRGSKSFEQDVREAVDTLNRRLQMIAEDDVPRAPQQAYVPPVRAMPQAPAPMPSIPVAHVGGVAKASIPKGFEAWDDESDPRGYPVTGLSRVEFIQKDGYRGQGTVGQLDWTKIIAFRSIA